MWKLSWMFLRSIKEEKMGNRNWKQKDLLPWLDWESSKQLHVHPPFYSVLVMGGGVSARGQKDVSGQR